MFFLKSDTFTSWYDFLYRAVLEKNLTSAILSPLKKEYLRQIDIIHYI